VAKKLTDEEIWKIYKIKVVQPPESLKRAGITQEQHDSYVDSLRHGINPDREVGILSASPEKDRRWRYSRNPEYDARKKKVSVKPHKVSFFSRAKKKLFSREKWQEELMRWQPTDDKGYIYEGDIGDLAGHFRGRRPGTDQYILINPKRIEQDSPKFNKDHGYNWRDHVINHELTHMELNTHPWKGNHFQELAADSSAAYKTKFGKDKYKRDSAFKTGLKISGFDWDERDSGTEQAYEDAMEKTLNRKLDIYKAPEFEKLVHPALKNPHVRRIGEYGARKKKVSVKPHKRKLGKKTVKVKGYTKKVRRKVS